MTLSEDSRYERTEEDLRDAFRILAGKKELDKISVSEITKVTGIARATFYNHYVDMPTFIDAMEEMILDEIFEMLRTFNPKTSDEASRHFFKLLCRYITENRYLARILVTPQANSFVKKALSMLHRYSSEKTKLSQKTGHAQEDYSYSLAYAIGGVVGVLHKWAVNNLADEPDAVAAHLTKLCDMSDFF